MKHCPICPDTELNRIRYEGFALQLCSSCGGALVEEADITGIERKRQLDQEQLEKEASLNMPDNAGILHCPRCLNDMTKAPALADRPAGFKSSTIENFFVDHCKFCHLTWFDGDELAKLQLSFERSAKGLEGEQHYVNYTEINEAQQARYRRTIAESVHSSGDALGKGFLGALAEMAKRVSRQRRC